MSWAEKGAVIWQILPKEINGQDICHIRKDNIGGQAARLFRLHYGIGINEKMAEKWVLEATEVLIFNNVITRTQVNTVTGNKTKPVQLSLF